MRHPVLSIPTIDEITQGRDRIAGSAIRTPLVRLDIDGPTEVWLKLENLQPIGSFKLRGALNAMRALPPGALGGGVYTASAGNMAQGVAWGARELGVACTVLVPDTAAKTKLASITRLGARTVTLSFDDWWRVLVEHGYPGMEGVFIHPVSNQQVIAGSGTVGLEIAEELGDIDAVFVPYGGGGLSCGIAAAFRALAPTTRVFAAEVETAAPFAASLAAGKAVAVPHTPSFVTGIGGKSVLAEMWPIARELLAGSRVVSLAAIEDALRLLVTRARVVAEGAGAASVAAALQNPAARRVVCVISGGNIDLDVLGPIMMKSATAGWGATG